jgi:hypothetical protein
MGLRTSITRDVEPQGRKADMARAWIRQRRVEPQARRSPHPEVRLELPLELPNYREPITGADEQKAATSERGSAVIDFYI